MCMSNARVFELGGPQTADKISCWGSGSPCVEIDKKAGGIPSLKDAQILHAERLYELPGLPE